MNTASLVLSVLVAQNPGAELDAQIADLQNRIAILEAGAAPPPVEGVYNVAEWIPDGGELADAFTAIQLDPGCREHSIYPPDGCKVVIPRGEYTITKTIHICRSMVIEGASGRGWGAGTRIITTTGTTAFKINSPAECVRLGFPKVDFRPGSGAWTDISNLQLRDNTGFWSPTSTTPVINAGVFMEARATVHDASIIGFTQGIRVDAGVGRPFIPTSSVSFEVGEATNANMWSVRDVKIDNSRHAGLYINGPDANAGYTLGLDSDTNCQDGDIYEPILGPCASIYDSSFLGNTHLAGHSSFMVDRRGNEYPHYLSDSPNSRNVWVGMYGENGQEGYASSNDIVLGGMSTWTTGHPVGGGNGLRIQNGKANSLCVKQDGAPYGAEVCMGNAAQGVLALQGNTGAFSQQFPLRVIATEENGQPVWALEPASLAGRRILTILAGSAQGGYDAPGRRLGEIILQTRVSWPRCLRVASTEYVAEIGDLRLIDDSIGVAQCVDR